MQGLVQHYSTKIKTKIKIKKKRTTGGSIVSAMIPQLRLHTYSNLPRRCVFDECIDRRIKFAHHKYHKLTHPRHIFFCFVLFSDPYLTSPLSSYDNVCNSQPLLFLERGGGGERTHALPFSPHMIMCSTKLNRYMGEGDVLSLFLFMLPIIISQSG